MSAKTLGHFWAILAPNGALHLPSGDPMIFANKGPHADSNAEMHNRKVVRVRVLTDEDFEPRVTALNVKANAGEPMQIDAQFAGESVKIFAVSMCEWFRDAGGANFVTVEVTDPKSGERFELSMQRAHAKTPAQRLCELQATLQQIRDTCGNADPLGGNRAVDLASTALQPPTREAQ